MYLLHTYTRPTLGYLSEEGIDFSQNLADKIAKKLLLRIFSHLQTWLNVNQQLLEKMTSFADWSANEIGVGETRTLYDLQVQLAFEGCMSKNYGKVRLGQSPHGPHPHG